MPQITLPDNSKRDFKNPLTVDELASKLGSKLSREAVAGKINGDVLAHDRLEVNAAAKIQGEVHVPSGKLLIQEGSKLDAKCAILYKEPPSNKALT